MGKLLNRATHYLRDEQETLRRVKGALTYPAIMLGFAMTTTIFLLAFVMPRFTKIYAQKQAGLPPPPQIHKRHSHIMVAHNQAQKPNVKRLLDDLTQQVQAGTDFSAALARHPRSFPRLFTALIKASERSGMMGKLLNRATLYLRDEQETLRRVKGALTYPAIMLAFAVTTTIFLLAFVMPRFTKIYAQKQAALPAPTQILMSLSNFMVDHYLALIAGALAVGALGFFYFRTPSGRRLWHYVQLNLPLFGPLFRKVHLSRGLRMIGTMSGAGVSLLDCVQTAEDLTDNGYFRDLWASAERQIKPGNHLSVPLF
jgi:type IV pilus assembly protein PilC